MDNNQYLISYFYMNNNGYYSLQKFNFINFGLENSDLQKNITSEAYEIKYANRIVSCFIMGKEIVVFLVGYENKYVLYIYDFNLNPLNKGSNQEIGKVTNFNEGLGVFSKAYHLDNRDVIFIYFTDPTTNSLILKTGTISDDSKNFTTKLEKSLNDNDDYKLNHDVLMNDFVKIDSKRFIFTTLSIQTNKAMYIYLFDLYNNYYNMNIRIYQETFNNEHKLNKEIEINIYNGLLIFSSTAIKDNQEYSILMIFGYANYTDNTIDISDYFMDDNSNNNKNLFDKLLENIKIENNIFQYYLDTTEIKLVSIPEEILFYNKSTLSETQILSGDHLSREYTFKQNLNKEKTYDYKFLNY